MRLLRVWIATSPPRVVPRAFRSLAGALESTKMSRITALSLNGSSPDNTLPHVLLVFDQPATGLITVSSVVIAVIGFALRNVISDLFSGIALGIDHPYSIGDWIETTQGSAGLVSEISWRTTRLIEIARESSSKGRVLPVDFSGQP